MKIGIYKGINQLILLHSLVSNLTSTNKILTSIFSLNIEFLMRYKFFKVAI
jgi:hypothetical protein